MARSLDDFQRMARRQLSRFRGRELDTAGDRILAALDGPARAVPGACAIRDGARALGLDIRSGVHTGECEVLGDKLAGIAVHIGARITAEAEAGEVVVSATVRDLVAGSGLAFVDRGVRMLRGVPGEWRLFSVHAGAGMSWRRRVAASGPGARSIIRVLDVRRAR